MSWALILLTPPLLYYSPYTALMVIQFSQMVNILRFFEISLPSNAQVFVDQFQRHFLTILPINLNFDDSNKNCKTPGIYKRNRYSCIPFNNPFGSSALALSLLFIIKLSSIEISRLKKIEKEKKNYSTKTRTRSQPQTLKISTRKIILYFLPTV